MMDGLEPDLKVQKVNHLNHSTNAAFEARLQRMSQICILFSLANKLELHLTLAGSSSKTDFTKRFSDLRSTTDGGQRKNGRVVAE